MSGLSGRDCGGDTLLRHPILRDGTTAASADTTACPQGLDRKQYMQSRQGHAWAGALSGHSPSPHPINDVL